MEYVVQVQTGLDPEQPEMPAVWMDVATVTVPARTHRKSVLAKAVEQMAESLDGPRFMRVIPEPHATPLKVEMEQPPPQLRIGT